jgi:hypothetical protein
MGLRDQTVLVFDLHATLPALVPIVAIPRLCLLLVALLLVLIIRLLLKLLHMKASKYRVKYDYSMYV